MDNPTFRLEGVVREKNEMEDFEGPLTLILQLLSKNKIEIRDIKISLILDQYLEYIDEMKSMDLEVASEFVAMASHLVYIKTRMLLAEEEEVSELEQLISSLETLKSRDTYARVKTVTERFAAMYRKGAGMYAKPPEYWQTVREYRCNHDPEDLRHAVVQLFSRENAQRMLTERVYAPPRSVYPVARKSEAIIDMLRSTGGMDVASIYRLSESRSELVATFVALLELCKAGSIIITDAENGGLWATYSGTNTDVDRPDTAAEEGDNGDS